MERKRQILQKANYHDLQAYAGTLRNNKLIPENFLLNQPKNILISEILRADKLKIYKMSSYTRLFWNWSAGNIDYIVSLYGLPDEWMIDENIEDYDFIMESRNELVNDNYVNHYEFMDGVKVLISMCKEFDAQYPAYTNNFKLNIDDQRNGFKKCADLCSTGCCLKITWDLDIC